MLIEFLTSWSIRIEGSRAERVSIATPGGETKTAVHCPTDSSSLSDVVINKFARTVITEEATC